MDTDKKGSRVTLLSVATINNKHDFVWIGHYWVSMDIFIY